MKKLYCLENGNVEPQYSERSGAFVISFKPKKLNDPVNDRLSQIINLISSDKHITREQLSEQCQVSVETIKRDLRKLKQKGQLKRHGSDKSGWWETINL